MPDRNGTGAASRRRPVGAECVPGGVSFRVWAPSRQSVSVVLEDGPEHPLSREADGYFSGLVSGIGAGARYRFRLDGDERLYPDPASRFQPDGPHGVSEVVDPSAFRWSDDAWRGVRIKGQVIYEMHVGTFTPEGTWAAAAAKLPLLKDIGVTVVEMMPVAEFPGRFGWGYDGVDLYAPTRLYGSPDDLRRFINAAHGLGIGVIHDVVYNHLGPKILTPDDPASHGAITSFRFKGVSSPQANAALAQRLLEQHRIFTVHRTRAANGACVRITPSLSNSASDVDRLAQALSAVH